MESILIISLALIIGLLATYLTKMVAMKYSIGTVPDQRKIHLGFVPHMGGLGIFLGGLAGLGVALLAYVYSQICQYFSWRYNHVNYGNG